MNIAICEDEIEQQIILENMINSLELSYLYQIYRFSSGEELVEAYQNNLYFSIILLDMQMKYIDGIKTAEIIRNFDKNGIIIIITSILEYAIEGYGINAFDFILKPVKRDKLGHIFHRAIKQIQDCGKQTYVIETREKTIVLQLSRILYVESNGRSVDFICENEKYISNVNITNTEKQLISKGFIRISRYFLVNLGRVKAVGVKEVFLDTGKTLQMSEKLRREVKKQYMEFVMEGII